MKVDEFLQAADVLNEISLLARAAEHRARDLQASGVFNNLARDRFRLGGVRRQLASVQKAAAELREHAVAKVETVVVTHSKGAESGT